MLHSINLELHQPVDYTYRLGNNLWDDVLDYCSLNYTERKVFIAIDSKVHGLHGKMVEKQCARYFKDCHVIQIPEGEKSKSINQWKRLQDELLANGVERSTPLLAVGGGVTGDVAGFAASSVLRGIPLVHIPTTLLAMVDSSIGGKTGINHPAGKNLIGAFYQPSAVFADAAFLETLERREWVGGLAEMLKYAAIRHPEMFDELEDAVESGFKPSLEWIDLIQKSAATKIEIVREDVHEAGRRAWLNFGHTFGHALERLSGYGNISHGEAVYAGMIAATHFSKILGAPVDEVRFAPFDTLYSINLPQHTKITELIEVMRQDKKVKDETIRLILLEKWGVPCIKKCSNNSVLENAWQAAFNRFKKNE